MLSSKQKIALKNKIFESVDLNATINFAALAKSFNITKKSIYKIIEKMIADKEIKRLSKGKYGIENKSYKFVFENKDLSEDEIWALKIKPILPDMTKEAYKALIHIFTEIFNNAIDHSKGSTIETEVIITKKYVQIIISDDGIGIFKNIQDTLKLSEERFAILELAKGKFTSDPNSHSGEGIFFSSKMADSFAIISHKIGFRTSNSLQSDYVIDIDDNFAGTSVLFEVELDSKVNLTELYKEYTEMPDKYGFTKTTVPVSLLEFGDKDAILVSRSQAKRLLNRFDKFESIMLDFNGINEIGQAFADEIFRVFPKEHPSVEIIPFNYNDNILAMILRVKNNR